MGAVSRDIVSPSLTVVRYGQNAGAVRHRLMLPGPVDRRSVPRQGSELITAGGLEENRIADRVRRKEHCMGLTGSQVPARPGPSLSGPT